MLVLNKYIDIASRNCLKLSNFNSCLISCNQKYRQSARSKEQKLDKGAEQYRGSNQKSLHIAVIGVPNAGKSTFINNLINHRVCPTSNKVHTTRRSNTAIYTTNNTQLVFYDTPGLVTPKDIKKHNLERTFKTAYRTAIQDADAIAVLHDVSNAWTRNQLHSTVIDTLKEYPNLPSILVLNKIDVLKSKRVLLDLIRLLTNEVLNTNTDVMAKKLAMKNKEKRDNAAHSGEEQQKSLEGKPKRQTSWENFEEVFLVSSLATDGLNTVQDYLIKMAKPKEWRYSSDAFTDETPEYLIVESVRARLLDYLPQEIPYNLKSEIEYYSEEKSAIYASVVITCPSSRLERLICGQANGKLRQITERVTSDLVETFGKPISLTISTTSKTNEEDKKVATNKV